MSSHEFILFVRDDGPAAKCQDIYEKDKATPSGYYDIKMGDHVVKVCAIDS